MAKKNTTAEDDDLWLDQIAAGENLDPDQRAVREMYETIDRALQNDLDAAGRIAATIIQDRNAGKPIDLAVVEKLTRKHAQIEAARDGMFALMGARNHPIHRYINLARKRMVKGHYPPSIGEARYRSLISAFVSVASQKIPTFNSRKAAKLAATIIEELGVGANTAAAIIAWESQSGAYGPLGRDGVNMYAAHLSKFSADQIEQQFKIMLADMRGGEAVSRILKELQKAHPLEK